MVINRYEYGKRDGDSDAPFSGSTTSLCLQAEEDEVDKLFAAYEAQVKKPRCCMSL